MRTDAPKDRQGTEERRNAKQGQLALEAGRQGRQAGQGGQVVP